jgi:riboflavin synthase
MFTGLIEATGTVRAIANQADGAVLELDTALGPELALGDSLATNGVCLTVIRRDGPHVVMDVSPETLRVTALGRLTAGRPVNLERPLRADGRLGGHVVQGHVDGVGALVSIVDEGEFRRLRIGFPADLAVWMVLKGSIAVDGISLTIAELDDEWFDVPVIPHTWAHTTLAAARVGDALNLECDLVGKYVVRLAMLERRGRLPSRPGDEPL